MPMIPITEAIDIIKRETARLGFEIVAVEEAVGRVLAEEIVADTDLPPFDRSQMDGFAVVASDTANAPVELRIVGESAAGKGWHHELKPGEAIRIMTGAPVPFGADAVQRSELAREAGEFVTILEPTTTGRFIVARGSEGKMGDKVFSSGEVVDINMIACLAAFGYAMVKVAKQPRVAILGTGSEIVEVDQTPGTDQIRNSNSVMLKVLAEKCGATVELFPITGDNLSDLKSQISVAVGLNESAIRNPQSQILIITGGVSVGKYDLTKAALLELGAEIFFDKLQLKPGKPMVFAKLKETLVFGLPGNPVSAAVTFHLFVRTAILQMQGSAETGLTEGFAVMGSDVKGATERDTYLPARLETDQTGHLIANSLRWQGSSDFIGFARANALIVVPKGKSFDRGEAASILFL